MQLQDELKQRLEADDWAVVRRKNDLNLWSWNTEIWVLKSRRAPVGFSLYLSFLIDPRPASPDPYWMIATSQKYPNDAQEAQGEPSLKMSPDWAGELPGFVAALDEQRKNGTVPDDWDDDEDR